VLDGVTAGMCVAATTALGSELAGGVVWSLVYLYLMVEHGQTPGKALMGTQIVGGSGHPVGFIRGAIVRNAVVPALFVAGVVLAVKLSPGLQASLDEQTFSALAGAFFLLSFLPILGRRRRCLHDYIAGTRVVKVR
jgi:uncharacterized RDD family membrane protein YckC